MVVPSGALAGRGSSKFPPLTSMAVPSGEPCWRDTARTWATEAMLGSASPRNPRVVMKKRSCDVRSLLVAWGRKHIRTSSASMPQPLSVTRTSLRPPSSS
jgi:hypothetical protein